MRRAHQGLPWLAFVMGAAVLWAAPAVVPDRILLRVARELPELAVADLLTRLDAEEVDRIPQIGVRIVRVPEAYRRMALVALARHPDVVFAEEDAIVPPDLTTPNDPYYGSQWHLPKVSANTAWDITKGSSSVTVAILDTGVDGTHPDLAPLMVPGWNFYNNNADTSDVYGHGTMVAGCAVAAGNNGIGIASVAWDCRIMPLRICDPYGYTYYSTVATALTWAADHGARVANISFSGVARSATVQSAAQYLQGKRGVTTASAGNDGVYINSPNSPYLLAVSATDSSDSVASFSTTGPFVDLAAPGVGIFTSTRGGGYGGGSGTSFSAPIVAGAAALVIAVNPALSALDVQDILTGTADDRGPRGYDPSYGYGRVNVGAAVAEASGFTPGDNTPPTVAVISPGDGSVVIVLVDVTASVADETALDRVELFVDETLVAENPDGQLRYSWDTRQVADGSHTLTAVAYDRTGNQAADAITVTVQNQADATPPVVWITSPATGVTLAKVQKVTVTATDNVGVVGVELYADSRLVGSRAGNSTGTYTFSWNTQKVAKGQHTLLTKAYDAAGNVAGSSITVYK